MASTSVASPSSFLNSPTSQKRPVLACAGSLDAGMGAKKLHREICKKLRLPTPDGCYMIDEMRAAVVAYHFRGVHGRKIDTITAEFGPAKSTLFRQQQRLAAALQLAGVSCAPEAVAAGEKAQAKAQAALEKAVHDVAFAIDFPKGGRPTLSSQSHTNPAASRTLSSAPAS